MPMSSKKYRYRKKIIIIYIEYEFQILVINEYF